MAKKISKEQRQSVKQLMDKGKKQGSLTYSEIMEVLGEVQLDKDQVENLYETLGQMGIEVLEEKNKKENIIVKIN